MRIQHNITAMNAYRNYNNNTSAIGKNLEKLSSGYKINRAGDDAAGLAVSQKMRLQIAGLEQAQKNAKSGISLVQTAEGAMTEVHDMLERMYTIAEQSANGTYDADTDRTQLQKELDQLRTEIDRIGKTANFNGIGLFAEYEGKKVDAAADVPTVSADQLTADDITGWVDAGLQQITAGAAAATAEYSFSVEDIAFAKDGVVTVGIAGKDYDVNVTKDMTASDFAKAFEKSYKKDKLTTGTATNTFEISVDGSKITLKAKDAGTVAAGTLTTEFGKDVTIKPADGSANKLTPVGKVTQDKAGCGAAFEINNAASKADIARLNEILAKNDVELTFTLSAVSNNAVDDGKTKLTIGGFTALGNAGYTIVASDGTTVTAAITLAAADAAKKTYTIKDMYGTKIADVTVDLSADASLDNNVTKLKLAKGGSGSGTFEADGAAESKKLDATSVNCTAGSIANINWSGDKSIVKGDPDAGVDGITLSTITGANGTITFTLNGLDDPLTVKLVDSETDSGIKNGMSVYVGDDTTGQELLKKIEDALNKQLKTQTENSEMGEEDYTKVSNIKLDYRYKETAPGMTGYEIIGTYDNTEMVYKEPAPTAPAAPAEDTGAVKANDIWFAIGAEANENNKLTLGTMHLGPKNIGLEGSNVAAADISGLDISDQQGGWDALEVIKAATNAVSDMRGTLGATQNRLDHTINNLSVMQENMQDAESVIRDTDVAEEMMAYTKNNILVQSAQAMLAQANQLPQGVLQLLG